MNVTYGLRRALQLGPDNLATAFAGRHRSWAETGARVARLAAGLQALGCDRGERLAVLSLNSAHYLELYLAAAWAGAVIVPINIRWSPREIADALADCTPKALAFDRRFADTAAALPGPAPIYAGEGEAPHGTPVEALIERSNPVPDAMRQGTDLAGIFYTGGTTGRSKGVMLSHGNVTANALNSLADDVWSPAMRYVHAAPMFHIANCMGMYASLLQGGANILIPSFTPEAFMQAVAAERGTEVLLVPTMVQMLVDHPALPDHDLSSLTRIVYGASPMSGAVLDRAMAALPGTAFIQAYGMTELSPAATILPWSEHGGTGRAKGRHRGAGRPIIGCEVKIVAPDGAAVPPGTVGEAAVRGDTVMLGYWQRPEETARAVIDGWMHTGDSGYLDADGYLYVVDRIKDMIISGGENVYSVEVENAVASYPGVAQCAVIGIPSERWGEQVHAVVVPKPGADIDRDELLAFCRGEIAGFKCPRSVDIREDPLPLSGAGKVLKRELRAPFWTAHDRAVV